jgi:hypothetical protein
MLNDGVIAERIGYARRCGYWEVDGKYFFDKAECLRHATKIKKNDVKYHFYDSAYKSLDWTKEPTEDLKIMYKRRAQQLRDTYDYLVLSFSGGSDSTNVLKSFVDNGIKLDEIFCEYPFEHIEKTSHLFNYDRNDSSLISYEWLTAAKPTLQKLSKTNPEIKITIKDGISSTILVVDNCEMYKQGRSGMLFNPTTRYTLLYETVRERAKFGKVGCISGVDKPRLAFDPKTQRFFSMYADTNNLTQFPHISYLETKYDLFFDHFYLTYEYPQLNQKQCFIFKMAIIDLIKNNNMNLYKKLLLKITDNGVHVFDVHHDFFKTLLYDFWDNSIYQAGKSENFFYPPTINWLYGDMVDDRIKDFNDKQIQELLHGIDKQFINYENSKPSNFRHYLTQPITF